MAVAWSTTIHRDVMKDAPVGSGAAAKELCMQEPDRDKFWFALSTKRNRERLIGEMLRGKGFE
jgi:hypothetical protein